MTENEKIAEYEFLIHSLIESYQNNDMDNLCKLVSHVRSEGLLYQDFYKENLNVIENLLKISLGLIRNPVIHLSDQPWWFIKEVYDSIFHQVRLGEYPVICADLYFKLSKEVLDDQFHKFYKRGSEIESYGVCIYFILIADNWFADRNEEFLFLYKRLEPLIGNAPDHLQEPWINRYKELA